MLIAQIARGRRQIVDRHAGEHLAAPAVRVADPGSVRLEPEDDRAEDPAVGEHIGDPRLHRAEVLAHDHRTRTLRLQAQDAEHRVEVEPHEGARVCRHPPRHPPQAEQAEHVVDAQAPGIAQHRAQHVAVRHEAGLGERIGAPRRLRPVLAHLVVHVGRRTDAHAAGEDIVQCPRVGALRVHADREVVHDPDRHAGLASGGLHGRELLVELPLHPHVELDQRCVLGAEPRDARRLRSRHIGGPRIGRTAEHIAHRAPDREVAQAGALAAAESLELGITLRGAADAEHHLERATLRLPDRIAIEQRRRCIALAHREGEPVDAIARLGGQQTVLRNVLDAQIDGIREPPGDGKVRGRGHRRRWRRRMERIDEHEPGAELAAAPARQLRAVAEVAQAP